MFETARVILRAAAKLPEVDLQADQEHVEDQPEVRRHADVGDDVRREDRGLQPRGERAERGRAEQDAREHLAHHPGLADPRHQASAQAGEQHHDHDRDEERHHGVFGGALLGRRDVFGQRRRGRAGLERGWREHQVQRAARRGADQRAPAAVLAGDRASECPCSVDQGAPRLFGAHHLDRGARLRELHFAAETGRGRSELVFAPDRAAGRAAWGPRVRVGRA